MPDLQSELARVRITLEITRAATGETETVELIGTPIQEDEPETPDEKEN